MDSSRAELPVHLVLGSWLHLIHGSAQASLLFGPFTRRKVNDVRDSLEKAVCKEEPVLRESALRRSTSSVPLRSGI